MSNLNNLFIRINDLGLNAKILSENTGISTGNISDWKSGRSMPTAKKLISLADFLNCSIDYLLGRTNNPEINSETVKLPLIVPEKINKSNTKTIIIPFYRTPASAGTGSWLSDETPVEYTNVPKTEKTSSADFMLEVRGDSMQPKFFDGDRILIKNSESIYEGEIGVFILNGESYIKKMGRNELISLNPAYGPIKLTEYDDIRCAGKVLGTLDLQ